MAADGDETAESAEETPAPPETGDGSSPDDADAHEPEDGLAARYDVEGLEEDVFRNVYGHDGAKAVTAAALRSGDVHVCYEGPPGSGKSVMLMSLEERVPGVIYRDGDQITASKLRDVLKSDPPILLVDEIDALDNDAYDVLSIPMEHGRLVRDSAREEYDVEVGTQVIGACNDVDQLPEHIRNRFRVLELEPYGDEEYVDLCAKMLPEAVEWIDDEATARKAGRKVLDITGRADPRDARDISQMARSLDEIDVLAKALHDPEARMDVGPLFPGEVKRAQGEVGKVHLRRALVDDLTSRAEQREEREGGSEGDAEPSDDGKSDVEAEIEAHVEESLS